MASTWAFRGNPLHVAEWGTPGGAEPGLLLVPGLGGSVVDWGPAARRLAERSGRHVVGLDLPGFGRSRLGTGAATVETYVEIVDAALDHFGPRVVVGNSMGGLVALLVGRKAGPSVRGLVLSDPAVPSERRGWAAVRGTLGFALAATPLVGPLVVEGRKRWRGVDRHVAQRLAANVHRPERVSPEVRAAMVELARERLAYREAGRAYSQAARSVGLRWSSGYEAARHVTAPTLVIHGAQDAVIPVSVVERLRAVRADWTYEVFDDCGHLPHVEHPERFTDAVTSWLARTAESPGVS